GAEFWFTAQFGVDSTQDRSLLSPGLVGKRVRLDDEHPVREGILRAYIEGLGMECVTVSPDGHETAPWHVSIESPALSHEVEGELTLAPARDRTGVPVLLLSQLIERWDDDRIKALGFCGTLIQPVRL